MAVRSGFPLLLAIYLISYCETPLIVKGADMNETSSLQGQKRRGEAKRLDIDNKSLYVKFHPTFQLDKLKISSRYDKN